MALKLAINTMTFNVQSVDFSRMVQAISKAGFSGIDMRDSHIQDHLRKGRSIQEVKNLLDEHRLHPIAIHALRNWQDEEGKRGKAYRKAVEQYFDLCKGMGCDFGVCAAWGDDSDLERDIRGFKEVCDIAKPYDLKIALEFLPWAELKDIQGAWEVVRRANCSNGGLLVDTFHFFKGGSIIEDFRKIPTEKIFLVHLDDAPDLLVDLKEMGMSGRLFPGEGSFPLGKFLDVLIGEKGYKDWLVLEVLNKESQHVGYPEIAEKGKKSLEQLLGRYHG